MSDIIKSLTYDAKMAPAINAIRGLGMSAAVPVGTTWEAGNWARAGVAGEITLVAMLALMRPLSRRINDYIETWVKPASGSAVCIERIAYNTKMLPQINAHRGCASDNALADLTTWSSLRRDRSGALGTWTLGELVAKIAFVGTLYSATVVRVTATPTEVTTTETEPTEAQFVAMGY